MEDGRSSRDKLINNQARPRGDTAEVGGGGKKAAKWRKARWA
jgi:hypothetical protein